LAEEGSALRQVRVGYLLAIRSAASGQGPRVPKRLVEFCLRQDWLEQSGGDLVLSQAGCARLRRSQTEGDPIRGQHQLRAQGGRCLSTKLRARSAGSRAERAGAGGR
jgi:hypothetical protein